MKTKKPLLFILVLIAVLSVFSLNSCRQQETEQLETFTVSRGDIRQEVSSTGYVESSQVRNYSLQSAGEVLFSVQKGQTFNQGDKLLEVDNQITILSLEQAKVNVEISESSLVQAKISFQQALDNNHIAVQLGKENKELSHQSTVNALVALQDTQKLTDKSNSYSRSALDSARQSVNTAQITIEAAEQSIADAGNILDEARDESLINDTQIAQYEANLNSARANLENALAQKEAAQLQAESAQKSYEQAKAQSSSQINNAQGAYQQTQINESITYWSTLGETQNTKKQILMAQQSIEQAEQQLQLAKINVEMASLDLDKNKVMAPFGGIVLAAPLSPGELASPGMSVISIIDNDYIISSNINETDITKLRLGQEVTFTLDAYYGKHYKGKITDISPLSENLGGLVSFEIEVTPDQGQDLLYGLSANLTIVTAQAADVLLAPAGSVYEQDGKQYVDITEDTRIEQVEVETGISDYEYIEIISGLEQGDVIITSRIEND
ncbi:MAG: efflux RND transporter periplasmic adaptor subunit [Actinomycetia bacterium]|nr:efflux RND transporter periplasmic adaptor subunit [Actinomycetes bacterium]